MHLTFLFEKKM